ncbi:MAG: IS1634 family transposase [Succinivibrio sp.]|nr:IS1634 family transposase [Succinivibrio sp.]
MSKIAPLPKVYCCKSKNRTYIRTYKNTRVKGKTYPVKTEIRNIAEIANGDGVGRLIFREDFLKENPKFIDRPIVRVFDEKSNKYLFRYANIHDEKIAEFSEHQKVSGVKSVGFYYVLKEQLHADPLVKTLQSVFPDCWEKLLSLGMFCADSGDFRADHYPRYVQEHRLPCDEELSSSQITRLFQSVTETEVLNFFSEYTANLYESKTLSRRRFWALDSTSISTYSRYLDARYGHSKQEENLPQVNVLMLTDERSHRPLFYEKFNGSIPDVSTVAATFNLLLHLDTRAFVAVMDRGYYSKSNLVEILSTGFHFVVCVPIRKVGEFDEVIENALRAFISGSCYDSSVGQNIYTEAQTIEVKDKQTKKMHKHKVYVHVLHSPEAAGAQTELLLKRRSDVLKMLEDGKELDGSNLDFAREYIVKKDDGSFEFNNAAFQNANNHAGVFVILSDAIAEGKTAYLAYRDRESVEDCFRDLKVKMNCNRFGVSTEQALTGKCFVEFLALSIRMLMQYRIENCKNNGTQPPYNSFKKIIAELNGVKEIEFTSGFVSVKMVSKVQQECLKLFKARVPADRYDNELAYANRLKQAGKPH